MPAPAHLNWQGKIGNGFKTTAAWLGRALTLSGRAAYADLFAPQPLAQGQVTSMTTRSSEASPLEPGFFIWILAWVAFGALLLITNQIWQIAAFVVLYLILLILSWLGLRQLAFSRQTLTTLAGLVTRKAQSVTRMQFNITTRRGQALVTMVGEIKGLTPTQDTEPQPGHFIQVWGTRTGDTIRAWKLEFLQVNWTPAGVWLSTPRLIPLSAGLLIPLAFWLVIRLLIAIVSGIK